MFKVFVKCSNDDPIFVGIEKVFARIVMKDWNNNDTVNDYSPNYSHSLNITYHCNVMNIFTCPFESKQSCENIDGKDETSKLSYKREDLFALHQISFAIEQAISIYFETTKNNEIIYEVDFENDRLHEIHTKYNGELQSWGWNDNVNEQLSKVKPISNIVIRDEQDVYNILTNREKLETLIEEYEKKNSHRLANEEKQLQICCDENTPCVHTSLINDNPNKKMIIDAINCNNSHVLHKGENCHNKNSEEESDNEKLISNLTSSIKDELEEHEKRNKYC